MNLTKKYTFLLLSLILACLQLQAAPAEEAKPKQEQNVERTEPEEKKITGIPKGWEQVPGNMRQIDIARGGKRPKMVGIDDKGIPYKFSNKTKDWEPLPRTGLRGHSAGTDLVIEKALYGGGKRWMNVTARIRSFVKNNQIKPMPVVHTLMGGDPHRKFPKVLLVWWRYGKRKEHNAFPDRSVLHIHKGLKIRTFQSPHEGRDFHVWDRDWHFKKHDTVLFKTNQRDFFLGFAPNEGNRNDNVWIVMGGWGNRYCKMFHGQASRNRWKEIAWTRRSVTEGKWQQYWLKKRGNRIEIGEGTNPGHHTILNVAHPHIARMNYFTFGGYRKRRIWFRDINMRGKPNREEPYTKYSGTANNMTFRDISVAPDGSIAAVGAKQDVWVLQGERWKQIPGRLSKVSIGSKNELCGVNPSGYIYRKCNPWFNTPRWEQFEGKANTISCSGDDTILYTAKDLVTYKVNRKNRKRANTFRSASIGLGTPKRLKVADRFNVGFLDYQNRVWIKHCGNKGKIPRGNSREHWYEAEGQPVAKDFSMGVDGSLLIIDKKNKILLHQATKEEAKKLELARGPEVRGGGMVSIMTARNHGYARLWTHASSPHDRHAKARAPHNHLEILVGGDNKQYTGSFFSLTHKDDPANNEPINFGDQINIFSLYSVKGHSKKAGALSKEWKWWVHGPHPRHGKKWKDNVVSLISHPSTESRRAHFKLMSPLGLTGAVRSHDAVIIQSLDPDSQYQPFFVEGDKWGNITMPRKGTKDTWAWWNVAGGDRRECGSQLFECKALNSEADVPNKKAKKGSLSPRDVYARIQGGFFKVAPKESKREAKARLKADHSAGIAVIREIRNKTLHKLNIDGKTVKAKDTLQGQKRELFDNLVIKGFSEETGPFGPERMIQLEKLWSEGIAWITSSLKVPGQTTVTCLVRAGDKGNAQFVLGNKIDTKAPWKIVLGGLGNKKSYILRGNRMMAEADVSATPLARLAPGRFVPYYFSIDKGRIIVGLGVPGDNIFMSCVMPDPEEIDRIGFSCHDSKVDFTEVKFAPPLVVHGPDEVYGAEQEKVVLPEKAGEKVYLEQDLRVANEGLVSFDATAESDLKVQLENEDGEFYQIIIGADQNKTCKIFKGDKQGLIVATSDVPSARLQKDKLKRFYISINGSTLVAGQGKPGDNVFALWEDQNPLKNIKRISFVAANHKQSIENITYAPPVTIGTKTQKHTYEKPIQQFPYEGQIKLLRYFHWEFVQDGQRVTLKDMVEGDTFSVIGTPQQGARYTLLITIAPDGTPDVKQIEGPKESPAKIAIQRSAALADIEANKLKDAAEGTFKAAEATGAWSGGDGKASYIMAGVGGAAIAAGAIMHGFGAKNAADAAKKRLEAKLGYRAHNSPVYTDLVEKAQGMFGKVPDAAKENRKLITDLLNKARFLSFNNSKHFEKLLAVYLDILRRISHPYVVADKAIKDSVYDALEEFEEVFEKWPHLYSKVMTLFLKAFSNQYLADKNIRLERLARESWYRVMLDIGSHLFARCLQQENFSVEIDALYGEYLWLPVQCIDSGRIAMTFQARSTNDVLVCFAQEDYQVKDLDNEIYEFALGSWDNTKHELRIKSLGKPAVEVDKTVDSKYRKHMLNARKYKTYWLEADLADGGFMHMGTGDIIGENTLIEWEDPFPWKEVSFIGFGSWDAEVQVRNILMDFVEPSEGEEELFAQEEDEIDNEELDEEEIDEELQDEEEEFDDE